MICSSPNMHLYLRIMHSSFCPLKTCPAQPMRVPCRPYTRPTLIRERIRSLHILRQMSMADYARAASHARGRSLRVVRTYHATVRVLHTVSSNITRFLLNSNKCGRPYLRSLFFETYVLAELIYRQCPSGVESRREAAPSRIRQLD